MLRSVDYYTTNLLTNKHMATKIMCLPKHCHPMVEFEVQSEKPIASS